MTEQTMLRQAAETECVCTTCKHFSQQEGGFYCSFYAAYLSEESLHIPCDFIEKIADTTSI